MASEPNNTQDATTGEEIASTTIPSAQHGTPPKRNAFTDLMSHKKPSPSKKQPHSSTPQSDPARITTFLGRDGLGAYITNPASFPASRVIYYDEKWVVINDLFPKSSIHLLLLPRDPAKQMLHPFDAFEDLDFLNEVQAEVEKLRILAAKELHRRFGKYSALDQKRQKALDALNDPSDTSSPNLPPDRDWSTSIISGIHAGPSMNHLHVHILSIDRHSECVRHRKHYNSFSTPFFVPVENFPLEKEDPRRHPGRERYMEWDLLCWRCGRGFGNKFARLKEHLGEEFEAWRKE
ncbi:hypothetical protein OEA41_001403 [Lepraria neglecta]|uniref:Aprataxin-like protein n=1 Tax=Lepraria neglecta TaxID=209136 RepID=A0AAD9ZA00_9LECA|nr:hypothetical protein OEA41_001403 [Lepraria neglecta]